MKCVSVYLISILAGVPAAAAPVHGDLHEQIAALDRRVAAAPEDAELRLRRADLHRRHESWDAALADVEIARTLRSGWSEIDLVHARLCLDVGWVRSARVALDRFLRSEPDRPEGLQLHAEVLVAAGDVLEGLVAFERLEAVVPAPQPDHYVAWSRAATRVPKKGPELALAVLERGMKRLGDVPALQLAALDLDVAAARYDRALERVDALARGAQRMERWLALYGDVFVQAGRHAEAHHSYSEALRAIDELNLKQRRTRAVIDLERRVKQELAILNRR